MRIVCVLLIWMAILPVCRAADRYVATNGNDDAANPGTSWDIALRSISNGVAKATTAGDVVWVSNGVYVVTNSITIQTTAITLRGQDRTNTILQGGYPAITNRGILLYNSGATVEEFTITQCAYGSGASSEGGGVRLMSGTLRKCIITRNYANSAAGVFVYDASCLMTNCEISSNTSFGSAGGVYINNGKVWNCTIFSNSCPNAGSSGGGVYMPGAGIIANSTISNNYSYGSGAGCYITAGVISNCTVANNWIPPPPIPPPI